MCAAGFLGSSGAWRASAGAAVFGVCVLFAPPAAPQSAIMFPAGSQVVVEVETWGAVEGLQGVIGGWVRYNYPMAIDCSPPRACYAKSQRFYYLVHCASGAMTSVRKISLDQNGGVVAMTEPQLDGPWYIPGTGSPERIAIAQASAEWSFRNPRQ